VPEVEADQVGIWQRAGDQFFRCAVVGDVVQNVVGDVILTSELFRQSHCWPPAPGIDGYGGFSPVYRLSHVWRS
jgi:hypothetical protein